MSQIENILSRMMNEPSFAEEVFKQPKEALSDFGLSTKEIAMFENISPIDFEAYASASPEDRKSFLRGGGDGGGWGGPIGFNHNESILRITDE